MEGVAELAEEVFHMPVRLGLPAYVTGLQDVISNPACSTAVGLLLFGNENRAVKSSAPLDASNLGILARMKNWLQGNF